MDSSPWSTTFGMLVLFDVHRIFKSLGGNKMKIVFRRLAFRFGTRLLHVKVVSGHMGLDDTRVTGAPCTRFHAAFSTRVFFPPFSLVLAVFSRAITTQ